MLHVRIGSRGGTRAHSRLCPTFLGEQTFACRSGTSEMCHFRTFRCLLETAPEPGLEQFETYMSPCSEDDDGAFKCNALPSVKLSADRLGLLIWNPRQRPRRKLRRVSPPTTADALAAQAAALQTKP
jgi:hypothetical protein